MRWLNDLIHGTPDQQKAEIDQYANDLQLLSNFRDNHLNGGNNADVLTIIVNQMIRQTSVLQRIDKGDAFTIPDQRGEMVFTKNADGTITVTFQQSNVQK